MSIRNKITVGLTLALFSIGAFADGIENPGGGTFTGGTVANAITAPAFIPNGATVPTNGLYLPAANTLGFANNSTNVVLFSPYTGNSSGAAPYEFNLNATTPPGPHDAASSLHLTAKDGDFGVIAIDAFGAQPILGLRRANGTNAAKTTLVNNDVMAQIGVIGTDSNGYSQYNAMLLAAASENWSPTAHGTRWGFITTAKTTNQRYDELQVGDGIVVSNTTYEALPATPPGLGNLRISGNLAVTTAAMESGVNLSVSGNATTPPTALSNTLLHLTSLDNTFGAELIDSFSNTLTTASQIAFRKAKGTNASPAALTNGTFIGYLGFQGYDGTAYSTLGKALIAGVATETWTTTARGSRLSFNTTANTTDTTNEKFRIWGSGSVVVGNGNVTTDPGADGSLLATTLIAGTTDATTSTGGALQITGGGSVAKRFWLPAITASAGLQTAVLCQSSGGEVIADSVACLASSARFKNLSGSMEDGALAKIAALPLYRWTYKPEGIFNNEVEHVGPIAEDVAAMDSRLVGYDPDGNVRTYSTEQLLAYTIKALQEATARIERLERR